MKQTVRKLKFYRGKQFNVLTFIVYVIIWKLAWKLRFFTSEKKKTSSFRSKNRASKASPCILMSSYAANHGVRDGCDIRWTLILPITHIDIDIVCIVIVSSRKKKENNTHQSKKTTATEKNKPPKKKKKIIPASSKVRLIFTGYCSNWMLPRKPGYSKAITS